MNNWTDNNHEITSDRDIKSYAFIIFAYNILFRNFFLLILNINKKKYINSLL